MSLRKRLAASIAMAMGGISVLAAGGMGTADARAVSGQIPNDTLIVALDGGIDTFDSNYQASSLPAQTIVQNVFDQLTKYQLEPVKIPTGQTIEETDTSKIIGMLASSYTVSKDGTTITFHIRPGLTYQNGNPLNAYTLKKGAFDRDITLGDGIGSSLFAMASVKKPSQVSAPNASTLVVHLSTPNTLFLQNDTTENVSGVDPKEMAAQATSADPWGKAYYQKNLGAGSGPFKLVSYTPGDQIVLERNDKYWAGPAKLSKAVVLFTPDAMQRVQMLESGTVDLIQDPPISDLKQLQKTSGVSVYSVPSRSLELLELNTKATPFNNKLVRQAFAYAIPYRELINSVEQGFAKPADSVVPNGMPTHNGKYWTYQTNLKKAAQLLAKAGYPNGKGLSPITFTIQAGTTEQEENSVFIQASLKQLGVNVQIQKVPLATFNQLEQTGKLQLFETNFLAWVNDPFYQMTWMLKSTSPVNYAHYSNPVVDKLISEKLLTTNAAARAKASDDIQKTVDNDVPYIPLYQPNFNIAARSNVHGYVFTNDQLLRFYYLYKK